MFKLQKKKKKKKTLLPFMTFSHYLAHSNLLFSSLKFLKLDDMVNSQILKLMHFFSNDNLPKQLDNSSRKMYLLIHITREVKNNSTNQK